MLKTCLLLYNNALLQPTYIYGISSHMKAISYMYVNIK